MQMPEALIVAEDPSLLQSLTYQLHRGGFRVAEAADILAALAVLEHSAAELVILDTDEDYGGSHVCERLRRQIPDSVVIVVSGSDHEEDKVRAFQAGADDYLTKPFSKKELMARIRANLKRAKVGGKPRIITAGDLEVNLDNYTVSIAGGRVKLTVKQFELLANLAASPGEVKTRDALAREVWGHEALSTSRTIDVHARTLRNALAESSSYEYIHTIRGLGLMFQPRPIPTSPARREDG